MSKNITNKTIVPADIEQRQRALDITASFCVSAPAGSGKTELLTQRLLKLLAEVEQPEQVLAITFTRKAAAEMRERLLSAIFFAREMQDRVADLNQLEPHKELTRQFAQAVLDQNNALGWGLLENPNRLRIQTIDSLCNAISTGEPIASRLGGGLQPVDDATSLYSQAVDGYLRTIKNLSPGDSSHPLRQLLDYFYGRQYLLKDLLVAMLPTREQWLPYAGELLANQSADNSANLWQALESFLIQYIEEQLEQLRGLLEPHTAIMLELATHAYENLQANQFSDCKAKSYLTELDLSGSPALPDATIGQHKNWLALLELFFVEKGTPRKRADKSIGFPADGTFDGALKKEAKEINRVRKESLKQTAEQLYESPEIRDAVATIRILPIGGYPDSARQQLMNVAYCLRDMCAHLFLHFAETGSCDHTEIQAAALRALGDHSSGQETTAVAYQWHKNIKHLLVDEFQDTSVSQFRLIEALSSDWQYENSEQEKPRTLFVVGDGMQSIYSFRQAKVGLFLRAKQQGIGSVALESLELKQNFRSSKNIVTWINNRFSKSFPDKVDWSRGAVTYSPSVAIESAEHGSEQINSAGAESKFEEIDQQTSQSVSKVSVVAVVDDGELRDNLAAMRIEAETIIAEIKAHKAMDASASVAVLVRSKKHALPIIQALEANKVAWRGVDMYPLKYREVVMDAMTLLRALHNPSDDIAWWAVLRAPWCGLLLRDMQILKDAVSASDCYESLADFLLDRNTLDILAANSLALAAFSDAPSEISRPLECSSPVGHYLESMSEDGRLRLAHVCGIVQAHWQQRARHSLRQTVESLWYALGGEPLARQSIEGDDRASAEAFFQLLEEIETENCMGVEQISVDTVLQRLDKLFANDVFTDTATEQEADKNKSQDNPPVQIMTIHKSKGLEFDIVVVPGLARQSRVNDSPILASRELVFSSGGEGVALSPRPQTDLSKVAKTSSATVYKFLREEQKNADAFELDRLFYVATTRAKTRLMLTAVVRWDEDAQMHKPPIKGSMLYKHWEQLIEADSVSFIRLSDVCSANRDFESNNKSECDFDDDSFRQTPLSRFKSSYFKREAFVEKDRRLGGEVNREQAIRHAIEVDGETEYLANENSNEKRVDLSKQQNVLERSAGVLFHDLVEQVHKQNNSSFSQHGICKLDETLARFCSDELLAWRLSDILVDNHWRLNASEQELVCSMVKHALESVQGAENFAWMFSTEHHNSFAELALCKAVNDGLPSVTKKKIDLTFVDSKSCRWVIDYKLLSMSSNIPFSDSPTKDTKALIALSERQQKAILEQYRTQLEGYLGTIELLDKQSGLSISETRCALYLPYTDQLLELKAN